MPVHACGAQWEFVEGCHGHAHAPSPLWCVAKRSALNQFLLEFPGLSTDDARTCQGAVQKVVGKRGSRLLRNGSTRCCQSWLCRRAPHFCRCRRSRRTQNFATLPLIVWSVHLGGGGGVFEDRNRHARVRPAPPDPEEASGAMLLPALCIPICGREASIGWAV